MRHRTSLLFMHRFCQTPAEASVWIDALGTCVAHRALARRRSCAAGLARHGPWPRRTCHSSWEDPIMWFRCVLMLIALGVAACSTAEARQDRPVDRAAEADHNRCLRRGFKPNTEKYVACRKQYEGRRAAEPAVATAKERSWWSQNPHEFSCKFWGYKPGTAVFEECVRWSEGPEARPSPPQDQAANCLRTGSGTVTPLTGSSFLVACPGRTFTCPGDINCPVCPGSIGCPPPK
jgi:hypothetical protein